MHVLTIKVQWPQMTPEWPLTPDIYLGNMCTLSQVTLCGDNKVTSKWWKNIIYQQTEKCLVYELWAFENDIFLYFTCKRPIKSCRITLITWPIRPIFGYVMRNSKLIISRKKYFKKIATSDDLAMWPLSSWTYEHHFVGKQSPLNVKNEKGFHRAKIVLWNFQFFYILYIRDHL